MGELLNGPLHIEEIRRVLKLVIDIDKPILQCVQREHAKLVADDCMRLILAKNQSQLAQQSVKMEPSTSTSTDANASANSTGKCEFPWRNVFHFIICCIVLRPVTEVLPNKIRCILRSVPIHRAERTITNLLTLRHMLEIFYRLRCAMQNVAPKSKLLRQILDALQGEELCQIKEQLDDLLDENANFQRERLSLRTSMCFALKVSSFILLIYHRKTSLIALCLCL